jgi:phosphoribosylanthranilate isomerase
MTRAIDAAQAISLGASYVGVIFAGGPRTLTAAAAREVLAATAGSTRRVGVFGAIGADEIARIADAVALDIVQLHADPDVRTIRAVRSAVGRPIWAALRVRGVELPASAEGIADEADGVVLDARVDHALGGTGVALPWEALAGRLGPLRGRGLLVLAGGLTPANVSVAIDALGPDVVDVSSGVESSPGIKDHQLMRAFAGAVHATHRAA